MLHPNQFQVNEAWIAFKLNDDPLVTGEGAHNAFALMDALSFEAEELGITVVRVQADQLLVFVNEAREAFRQHVGGGGQH
jgi:hypothetical protein